MTAQALKFLVTIIIFKKSFLNELTRSLMRYFDSLGEL